MTRLRTFCGVLLFACCGAPGAQQGDLMANLERDARRFAECFNSLNADCVFDLTHVESMVASGIRSPYMDREALRQLWSAPQEPVSETTARGMAIFGQTPDERMTSFAARRPLEPIIAGAGRLYAFVPFFQTNTSVRGRLEREGFFVSVSENAGQSWRFVVINGLHIQAAGVPRIFAELAGHETPRIKNVIIPWPEPAESDYLRTTDGGFEVVEGGAWYTLSFDVRKRPSSDMTLAVSFENPVDPSRPVTMQATLAADEDTLNIHSPGLSGFEPGQHYETVIVGIDSATNEELFEHRQTLLFDPTSEMLKLLASGDGSLR